MKPIINTCPHALNFVDPITGAEVVVPAPAKERVLGARMVEVALPSDPADEVEIVTSKPTPTPEGEALLARIEAEFPGHRIVGSIIAAQAYPGRVFSMVPAPGFERVPPAEKRMNFRKFNRF